MTCSESESGKVHKEYVYDTLIHCKPAKKGAKVVQTESLPAKLVLETPI